ncbi:asparagine synthase (glutamine-hydrolyzing) [Pseudomonas sp. S3E17]|jgi:asparagine synthase (glutamine-hydrolysing)|nr:asparagine synthase (glutamine-hydrolyzing) [Pseudomonas sp. S3E17]
MLDKIWHRGPDGTGTYINGPVAMGMRRLSIIDAQGSAQPLFNESGDIILVGNGEIFNYRELRQQLQARGHCFKTEGDLEVVVHLYEEMGTSFVHQLNGQFSLALFDKRTQALHIVRDHFGITPVHYGVFDGVLVFASEIKAMLCHPAVPRRVDLAGLDQILCFPGLTSPRSMFKGISALPPGHCLSVTNQKVTATRYWDLNYPADGVAENVMTEDEAVEEFSYRFKNAVALRLRADTPVGVYLSGGLDSSIVAAVMRELQPDRSIPSFSITFPDSTLIDERKYQRLVAQTLKFDHHEIAFSREQIASRLRDSVWHSECPIKETYNTCTMALAEAARASGVPVVLGGEGADELLGGYPGYRFDQFAASNPSMASPEEQVANQRLWGAPDIRYERQYGQFSQWRRNLFSADALHELGEQGCLGAPILDIEQLKGRHRLHQRSYIDVKARLGDHLLGDHGDRMNMAYSIEGRYPFLDRSLCDFLIKVPPSLKLRGLEEKYLLKQAAKGLVPERILNREKFGFRAPGSPYLLSLNEPWIEELLAPETLKRQGYLNVEWITRMIDDSRKTGRTLNPHIEDDAVLLALTFGIFLDLFDMPNL